MQGSKLGTRNLANIYQISHDKRHLRRSRAVERIRDDI